MTLGVISGLGDLSLNSRDVRFVILLCYRGVGGFERRGARQVAPTAAVQDGADRDAGVQRDAVLHSINSV